VLENNCLEINVLMGVIANEFEPIIVKNNKEMRVTLEANNFIPDVILFDIKSGDRDGYDTLHYLTSHKDFRNIPLVLSSSDTRSKHVIRGLRAGATDYLTKPFCQSVVARLGNQAKISRLINPYLSIQ
jgi:DNA-binding response OmpR family regulator